MTFDKLKSQKEDQNPLADDALSLSKWEEKRLGEVCEVGAGNSAPQDKDLFLKGTYPFFRTSDVGRVKKGFIDSSIDRLNDEGIKKLKLFSKGTILFPKSGASTFLNHRVMMNVDGYVSSHLATIKSKAEYLNDKFLLYYLITIDAKHLMQDISYPSLKISDIKQIPIPLPSLSEQKKIVEVLDQAFAGIEQSRQNTKQNLKNAKEIFESYLQGVFENKGDDWEEKKLGGIGSPKMCKRIFKEQTKTEGDIPFYKIGTFGKEPDAFISKEIYDEFRLKYSFPKEGDVLISASGTIGRRVKYNGEPAYFQDSNIVWIENDEKQVLNDFLFEFYGACNWGSTKGATISRLYNDNLKNIKIVFPKSKAEQQSVVRQLDALRAETQKLEAIYTQKLNDLEELKKSLLQKAFAGELVK
jgi:type I restriction enzyme S subunit